MTFKEMAGKEDWGLLASLGQEESGLLQMLTNQSPIMKLWFLVMALNFILVMWLV